VSQALSLCGVIQESGRYLVAKRNPGGSQGGKWEFPGGKLEPGESSEQALVREFAEELSVGIRVGRLLFEGSFTNGEKSYRLEAWETTLLTRDFCLTEHQELRWGSWNELAALDFSDSDRQVFDSLFAPLG